MELDALLERVMEPDQDICLPLKIKHKDFGLISSLIQLIATWVRNKRSGNLILPIENTEQLKDYIFEEFAYPSIGLCREKKIKDLKGNNLWPIIEPLSLDFFKRMNAFEPMKGSYIPIHSFDKKIGYGGLHQCFYTKDKFIEKESVLDSNLYHFVFKDFSKRFSSKSFSKSISKIYDDIIAIIYELFSNTHTWARSDEKQIPLYPNIRSVYLKFHKRPIEKYIEEFSSHEGLNQYFRSSFQLNSKKELYLLELSIIDSGPGLYKRFTGKSTFTNDIYDEVEIIKECLNRHSTSATGMKKLQKGLGLDRVMQILNNKGFFFIRSGRTFIYRDMKSNPYLEVNKAKDIQLYDWNTYDYKRFTFKNEAVGTLITIVLPIDYYQYE